MKHRAEGLANTDHEPVSNHLMGIKATIKHMHPEDQDELLVWMQTEMLNEFWDNHTVNGQSHSAGKHSKSKLIQEHSWNSTLTAGMTDEEVHRVEESLGFRKTLEDVLL